MEQGDAAMARAFRGIAGSVLAMVAAVQPLAAAAPVAPLEKLTQSKTYQANIYRLFNSLPADVFTRCPALVSKDSQVTVIRPPRFAPDGMPVSGAWKQSFPISGCGQETTINLYFTASADKKIESMVGIPGDTHADPVLQRDVARQLLGAIHGQVAACADLHVRHSRYDGGVPPAVGATPAPGQTAPWRETWVVSACKQTYTVPLTFTPSAMGTQFSAAGATITTP
jgi:hypothetical protein